MIPERIAISHYRRNEKAAVRRIPDDLLVYGEVEIAGVGVEST